MSTPLFQDFDPRRVPWQWESVRYARDFDYTKGVLETFSSGSVGSAKTIKDIHEIVKCCLENPGSRWLMVRRALKDLKRTSWKVLLQHMADIPHAISSYHKTDMLITFANGSEIMGDSYNDGDLTKFQSLELSGLDIEETNEMPRDVYDALKMRIGRIPAVKVNRVQARCNPEGPSHWLYDYFIMGSKDHPNRKVFYSLTEQNPFLPPWYIENLKRDLDPKQAQRKLYGIWIEIDKERVYYNYDSERNFLRSQAYEINQSCPIDLMFDFNIANGKPMSMAVGQAIGSKRLIFAEFHAEGARTLNIMEEIEGSGLLDSHHSFRVFGDPAGKNNDTRSIQTDYDIIKKFLSNYGGGKLKVEMMISKGAPPIRRRHNTVNASFMNESGEVNMYLFKGCDWLDKGFRLTSFKKGAQLLEDDSLAQQHVTTAVGYWCEMLARETKSGARSL